MTRNIPVALMLTVALGAITGCSAMPDNPRLADAQGRLSAAYNDKETADRGQGDLANAKTALQSAQAEWAKNDRRTSDHQLTMAQTYLDIAETRGRQAKVEDATAKLSGQVQMAGMDKQLAQKDQQIAGKNQELAGKTRQLADSSQALADAQAQLRDLNMKNTDLGSTMVLQDVSFETGKSDLLAGGVNRLQPLINYLRLSPATHVRIEGYTDNTGGAIYNRQLSLQRANSVRDILTGANIAAERIQTVGSGLDKPVASNDTISGRQSNRRVEITLLKQPGL